MTHSNNRTKKQVFLGEREQIDKRKDRQIRNTAGHQNRRKESTQMFSKSSRRGLEVERSLRIQLKVAVPNLGGSIPAEAWYHSRYYY